MIFNDICKMPKVLINISPVDYPVAPTLYSGNNTGFSPEL
jgi:hypothetical protein